MFLVLLSSTKSGPRRCANTTEGLTTRRQRSSWLIRTLGDPRVVPIKLPAAQTEILRDELLGWLAGIEEDLESDQLPDPGADACEADAFRRLLTALDRAEVELPDEEAHEALSRAAKGYDEASGYERVVAVHNAHHALLSVLG
jgi:hypothetical protein